jgi:hypothetical protein
MSENEGSNAQELVEEQETVNARNYMASCDQRKQNEKDSEQLYWIVGEEKQEYNEISSTNIYPMVGVLDIIASSWPAAVVDLFHIEEIDTCGNG